MRMLDGSAHHDEQLEPLIDGKFVFVTILGDGSPVDQLHHKIGLAIFGCPGVVNFGNVLVVHQCQSLLLGFEPSHDTS